MSLRKLFLITLCMTAVLLIIIPSIQAEYPEGGSEEKININTATFTDFVKLRGVTLKHARRIIAYRNEHGPFLAPEDIVNVPGIGPRTWELNKDRIVVDDEAPDAASEN
jgi:competence protein ComEA